MKTKVRFLVVAIGLAGLTVGLAQTPPQITGQPTNRSVSIGASALFRVTASGSTPLSYQWRQEGKELPGRTSPTLNLIKVQLTHAGAYDVVVTNALGAATSQVARLEVDPTFTKLMSGAPVNDPSGDTYCPAWGDYDGDGDLDLLVAGGYWSDTGYSPLLYTNRGNGAFSRLTSAPFSNSLRSSTANWADYDNDGDLDLWNGNYETSYPVLFTNRGGGQFSSVVVSRQWIENQVAVYGSLQAWGDYDGDGFVDLAVATGNHSSLTTRPPMTLLHNSGNGKFTANTNSLLAGIKKITGSLAWVDYDEDGDLDLLTTGDSPLLFRNDGGILNAAPSAEFEAEIGWGWDFAWGDYDNDGDLDLYTNGRLFRNDGAGHFEMVDDPKTQALTVGNEWVATWGDYDNDGYLDLFVSRGVYGWANRNCLFHNDGQGGFDAILSGSPVNDLADSWGCSWADYDGDGDLDLFVANTSNSATADSDFFYINNGNANHWLQVKLVGAAPQPGASNRDGIGAKIRVKATVGGKTFWQLRTISSGSWHTELVAHFGLGDAARVEALRIEWPSGIVQEFQDLTVDQSLTVAEEALVATINAEQVGPGYYDVVKGASVKLQAPPQEPGVTYQWQLDGWDIPAANGPTLEIASFQATQIGHYSVVLYGLSDPVLGHYWARSRPARLEIKDRPIVSSPAIKPGPSVSLGTRVEISALIAGTEDFTCQWQKSGQSIPPAENATATNATLVLESVTQADIGKYRVLVSSAADTVTSDTVSLEVDPTFVLARAEQLGDDGFLVSAADSPWPRFVDFDDDGWFEVLLLRGAGGPGMRNEVYENNQDGSFKRITNGLATVSGQWLSMAWADLDGDGDLDCVMTASPPTAPTLFWSQSAQGTQDFVAARTSWPKGILPSCVDYDQDGWTDIANTHWLDYGGSTGINYLAHNAGGLFQVITDTPFALRNEGIEWSNWVDYDNDGDIDFFGVTSPFGANARPEVLFQNQGNGNFLRITNHVLVKEPTPNIMAGWADYDNDGDLDVVLPYHETLLSAFYRNVGGGQFEIDPAGPPLDKSKGPLCPSWGDYDNDGDLDLLVTHDFDRCRLFNNDGTGKLTEVWVGGPTRQQRTYHGSWVDYDNDGFLDLLAQQFVGDPPALFRNNLRQVGNRNHWLKVRLHGVAANPDGLGAKIRVQATIRGQTVWQMREIGVLPGYATELLAHFGLGDASKVQLLRIEWPSGWTQDLTNVAADQFLTVREHQDYVPKPDRPLPTFASCVANGDGGVTLSIAEPAAGVLCVLETSTDLVHWTKLAVRRSTGATFQHLDTPTPSNPARFYRVVVP